MKFKLVSLITALCAFALSGCVTGPSTGSTSAPTISQQIAAQITPARIAKGTQDVLGGAGAAVLANNSSYVGEVSAAADVFSALAASDPSVLTAADIVDALSKSKVSAANQKAISAAAAGALGLYESDFKINFPALKPNYALYATAVANGLNIASGHAEKVVPLPSS